MLQSNKTTWDCRQAKAELALQAGDDAVTPATAPLLETHLEGCAECREYLAGLTLSLETLKTSAAEPVVPQRMASLWPKIAARLPTARPQVKLAPFNVWVPTAAMAAACAAMILVTIVQLERVAPFQPQIMPRVQEVFWRSGVDEFRSPDFRKDRGFGPARTAEGQVPVRLKQYLPPGDF